VIIQGSPGDADDHHAGVKGSSDSGSSDSSDSSGSSGEEGEKNALQFTAEMNNSIMRNKNIEFLNFQF
jgi:hypothetical protein